MANESVAWSVSSRNEVSIIREGFQGPPISGDDHVVDISYSVAGMVFILHLKDNVVTMEYGTNVKPPDWKEVTVILPAEVTVRKIDASPKNEVYMVLSDGTLAVATKPKKGSDSIEPKVVEGVDECFQVSAAPDGIIWVVACDPNVGSVVQWLDPKTKKWSTVPEINNARRVTGTDKGKAYIITSDGDITLCDKKGVKKEVPVGFHVSEISVGDDGALWATEQHGDLDRGNVHVTTNQGKKWTAIEGVNVALLDAGTLKTA